MKLRARVIIPSCGVLIFLAILFAPILLAASWHLLHGNSVECAGRSLSVPLRWYAKTEGKTAHISKLSPTVLSKSPASGLISLWPVEFPPKTEADKELAYQSFASVYWTHLAGGAGETNGPFRTGNGERETVCMETSVVKDKWISVSCLVFRGTWYGTFYGDPKELGSFYRIIDNSE